MDSPLTPLTWYGFEVTKVIDGDTLGGVVDLGGGSFYPTHVRLAAINAPELKHPTLATGHVSRLAMVGLVGVGDCEVAGVGTTLDKYGRVIGWVRRVGTLDLFNDLLLAGGFAAPFMLHRGFNVLPPAPRP